MPDITMCANDDCPHAETCHRNPAGGTTPHPTYQSWSRFTPDEDGDCDYYSEAWPHLARKGGETT